MAIEALSPKETSGGKTRQETPAASLPPPEASNLLPLEAANLLPLEAAKPKKAPAFPSSLNAISIVEPPPEAKAAPKEPPKEPPKKERPAGASPPPGKGGKSAAKPPSPVSADMEFSAFADKFANEDIDYMSPVEAAILARGRRSAIMLSVGVAVMFLTFVFWSAFFELDEFIRAMGQVIPSSGTQVIQNLEGGIVDEILVKENSLVEKGDLLMRINNEGAASGYRDAYTQSLALEGELARLAAERDGLEHITFPEHLLQYPDILRGQEALFMARRSSLELELDVLKSQLSQKEQELKELKAKQRNVSSSLGLAQQESSIAKPLVDKGIYPQIDWISLQRNIVSLQGDLEGITLAIPRTENAAKEIQKRLDQRIAVNKIEIIDEFNKKTMQFSSLRENLSVGEDRVTRTEVRSPVRGTVKQIMVTTIGGVIRPGEPIMEIVPLDDTLLIEAKVKPSDIAFIQTGQMANIQITAFDPSIYGSIKGNVETISADTLSDEANRGESFYRVTLRTESGYIAHAGQNLTIIPGMMATVDIMTGRKTVLAYLLKPLIKASQEAMRER
ncbi:MAG: HlyD family type I secretion periplasmic adaptor subunit [Desulfarculales bacterium]|jgi:adhesin transport system membrane fusion protein|nr:HlyD family type I secretion periplasmic adaptor subunit [Desulfarculales bacterium]